MKTLLFATLLVASLGASAKTLNCTYISSEAEKEQGFLTEVTADFQCDGLLKQFIGSNNFVSCKPQFTLLEFVDQLTPGEAVQFEISDQRVSSIDGSSQVIPMVRRGLSATGIRLEPQVIVQHNKPVVCDPTQIQVR